MINDTNIINMALILYEEDKKMTKPIRLTQLTKSAGWAGKIGPDVLAQVLRNLPKIENDKLIINIDTSDDAAVYKFNEETALIQTLDFFTPVVDDPYTFGQIAAANSLSDVYAMGGQPLMAMNIVCFPNCLKAEVLGEILKGGADKVKEAGALLVGGHSVEDDEPKYGLSVTGTVHPDKVLANNSARVGDYLILTKPLGLGVLNTAIKGDRVSKEEYNMAVKTMVTLNKYALDALKDVKISSCTDVTGFGLLGHATEMAKGSEVSIEIYSDKVPIIKGAKEYAREGIIPGGMYANRRHIEDDIEMDEDVEQVIQDLMFDPQTSGGLLVAIREEDLDKSLESLSVNTDNEFALIGRVIDKDNKALYIKK